MIGDVVIVNIRQKTAMYGLIRKKQQHPVGTRIDLRLVVVIIRRREIKWRLIGK